MNWSVLNKFLVLSLFLFTWRWGFDTIFFDLWGRDIFFDLWSVYIIFDLWYWPGMFCY